MGDIPDDNERRRLGLDTQITRRDFVNGAPLALDKIKDIKVVRTATGGNTVYQAWCACARGNCPLTRAGANAARCEAHC